MKLLTAVLPQLRHVLTHGRFFTPSVLVLIGGLEMFGRNCSKDAHDIIGMLVLLLIVGGVAFRHRVNPLPWIKFAGKTVWWVARFGDRFKVDVGPDLRGTPALPRRMPLAYYALVLVLLAWGVGAAAVGYYVPDGWRPYASWITYTGYLVLLCLLWGLLIVGILGGVYFPIMLLNRLTQGRLSDARLSRGQLLFFGVYFGGTLAAATISQVPIWPMFILLGVFWLVAFVISWLPTRPDAPQLLWRPRTSRTVRAIPLPRLLLALTTVGTLLLMALLLTAAGSSIFGNEEGSKATYLTTFAGRLLAWLTLGLMVSAAGGVFLAWRNNPARPTAPMAYATALPNLPMNPKVVAERLRAHGWKPHFDEVTLEDVPLIIVPPMVSQLHEFDPRWPLAVSEADLLNPLLYERMARRDELQRRRRFLKKLEFLFKEAKGRTYEGGCGFWLAPHLWFVAGLTRDEVVGTGDDEPSFLTEIIGPPYSEVFSFAVRCYIFKVLKALQVDLIFIEDGISYKQLAKVFRLMFEVYDKSAGQRRLEDTPFRGMTKIKIMFHEFDINEPFRPSLIYPEPKFAPLGRLRVMHIFRDRGEDEELVEPPFNFDATPVPHLVG